MAAPSPSGEIVSYWNRQHATDVQSSPGARSASGHVGSARTASCPRSGPPSGRAYSGSVERGERDILLDNIYALDDALRIAKVGRGATRLPWDNGCRQAPVRGLVLLGCPDRIGDVLPTLVPLPLQSAQVDRCHRE